MMYTILSHPSLCTRLAAIDNIVLEHTLVDLGQKWLDNTQDGDIVYPDVYSSPSGMMVLGFAAFEYEKPENYSETEGGYLYPKEDHPEWKSLPRYSFVRSYIAHVKTYHLLDVSDHKTFLIIHPIVPDVEEDLDILSKDGWVHDTTGEYWSLAQSSRTLWTQLNRT